LKEVNKSKTLNTRSPKGSVNWVMDRFRESPTYEAIARKQNTLNGCERDLALISKLFGPEKIEDIGPLLLRDTMSGLTRKRDGKPSPNQANKMKNRMRQLFREAIVQGVCKRDLTEGVDNLRYKKDEYQPWPEWALDRFFGLHPFDYVPSLQVRFVVALGLYTGQREGDCLNLAIEHRSSGLISVVQEKTDERAFIQERKVLKEWFLKMGAPDVGPQDYVFARNTVGDPWTGDGFRSSFYTARKNLGLLDYQFHGLRKNAVSELLEASCSVPEASSVSGQSMQMVEHYAKRRNQMGLSRIASSKIELVDETRENRKKWTGL
jgi:integrase